MMYSVPRIKFWQTWMLIAMIAMITGCDFDFGGTTNILFKRRQARTTKTKKKDPTGNGSTNDSGSGGFSGSVEIKVTGQTVNSPNVWFLNSNSMSPNYVSLNVYSDSPLTPRIYKDPECDQTKNTNVPDPKCKEGSIINFSVRFCEKDVPTAPGAAPLCSASRVKKYTLNNEKPFSTLILNICKNGQYKTYTPPTDKLDGSIDIISFKRRRKVFSGTDWIKA